MASPRSDGRADHGSTDGSPARRVWSDTHWAEWLTRVDEGKRSEDQIAKNALELGTILAAAGFEGPDDIVDLSETEMKSLAGSKVTPLTSFAVRARAFARRAADALRDDTAVQDTAAAAAPTAHRKPAKVEHDREARLKELGLGGLAESLKPSQDEINSLQSFVDDGKCAHPPYKAFPATELLQRYTPPYMLSTRPELRALLEEDRERERNGKPRRPQHFESATHWAAAKLRWSIAAMICGVIDASDAFNTLGNALRVANQEKSWATGAAYDLLQADRLQNEARARAGVDVARELRDLDERVVADARREKERRTDELKKTKDKKVVLTPNQAAQKQQQQQQQQQQRGAPWGGRKRGRWGQRDDGGGRSRDRSRRGRRSPEHRPRRS